MIPCSKITCKLHSPPSLTLTHPYASKSPPTGSRHETTTTPDSEPLVLQWLFDYLTSDRDRKRGNPRLRIHRTTVYTTFLDSRVCTQSPRTDDTTHLIHRHVWSSTLICLVVALLTFKEEKCYHTCVTTESSRFSVRVSTVLDEYYDWKKKLNSRVWQIIDWSNLFISTICGIK